MNTNLPPITEAKPQTNRDRMSEHVTNPSCSTCHKLTYSSLDEALALFDELATAPHEAPGT